MSSQVRAASTIALLILVSTLAACSEAPLQPAPYEAPETSARSSLTQQPSGQSSGRFDALTITVVLPSASVPAGGTLGSHLLVENQSNQTVVDPACLIGTGRYALIAVGEQEPEFWWQPMVDCGGPYPMKPGFKAGSRGPRFAARTKTGEPLPTGRYLAVLEIRGLTERVSYPVTVT